MYYSEKKKQRGQRRKYEALCRKIDAIAPDWQTKRNSEVLCVSNLFIGHPKTYSHFKTAFCRKVIEKTEQLIAEKPEGLPFCRVVALIFPEEMILSKIIIFHDEEFFGYIMPPNNIGKQWTAIESGSFAQERNIKTKLKEWGYSYYSPDFNGRWHDQDVWIYGEL